MKSPQVDYPNVTHNLQVYNLKALYYQFTITSWILAEAQFKISKRQYLKLVLGGGNEKKAKRWKHTRQEKHWGLRDLWWRPYQCFSVCHTISLCLQTANQRQIGCTNITSRSDSLLYYSLFFFTNIALHYWITKKTASSVHKVSFILLFLFI